CDPAVRRYLLNRTLDFARTDARELGRKCEQLRELPSLCKVCCRQRGPRNALDRTGNCSGLQFRETVNGRRAEDPKLAAALPSNGQDTFFHEVPIQAWSKETEAEKCLHADISIPRSCRKSEAGPEIVRDRRFERHNCYTTRERALSPL